MSNNAGVAVWNNMLEAAMKLPGVRINRVEFLTKEIRIYKSDLVDIKNLKPEEILEPEYIRKIASKCIDSHTKLVTVTSTVAGIPGGLAIVGSIPIDVIQYYGHILALSQKLAYLYGYGDFVNNEEKLSEEAISLLTIFIGIGFGAEAANKALRMIAKNAATSVANKVARNTLTKTTYYPIIKKIASYIGIKITKDSFAKGISKIVPVIGAATSGGLTYITFKPMARKINRAMNNDMMDRLKIKTMKK